MSTQHSQSLPGHTTAGLMYSNTYRTAIISGAVIACVLSIPLGVIPVGIAVLLVGVILVMPAVNRRNYVYQLVVETVLNRRLRRKRGRLSTLSVSSILYEDDDQRYRRLSSQPVKVNFLPLDEDGQEYLSEIVTSGNGLHTFPVLIDSWGDAAANDPETVIDLANAFSSVLRSLATSYGLGLRMALFFVRTPVDPTDGLAWFESHRFKSDDLAVIRLQENFLEAMTALVEQTGSFLCGITVSVARPTQWSRLKPELLPLEDIMRSKGYLLSQQLIAQLENLNVQGVHRPDPYETAIMLRGSLNLMELPEMYRDWYVDRQRMGSHNYRVIEDSLVLADGAFPDPSELVAKRDYLRIGDKTYSRTLHAPNFVKRQVSAGFMTQLFDLPPNLWAGITLSYRTSDPKTELRRQKVEIREVDRRRFERRQQGSSQRAREEDEATRIREEDEALYFSGGDSIHLRLLATVSAPSLELLEEATSALKNQFRSSPLPLRAVHGDVAQWETRLEALGLPTTL